MTTKTIEEQVKAVGLAKAMTKNDEECLKLIMNCNSDFDELVDEVNAVVETLKNLYQYLCDCRVADLFEDRLQECKEYYYKTGYQFKDSTFIEAIVEMYQMIDIKNQEDIYQIARYTFGDSFIDLFGGSYGVGDKVEIDMDDTKLYLDSVSSDITDFLLIDYSGSDTQMVHMDWLDDEYLEQMANGILEYLEQKKSK